MQAWQGNLLAIIAQIPYFCKVENSTFFAWAVANDDDMILDAV
jgi:hypothetical protein